MKLLKGCISFAIAMVLGILILLWAPGFWGYEMYYVSSGSMQPEIRVGDLILVKETTLDELKIGDIITYSPDHGKTQITHRVVRIDLERRAVKTKGDANEMEDTSWVRENEVTGIVSFHIRDIGILVCVLSTMTGKLLVIAFLMWLMAIWLFADRLFLMQKRKEMCGYKE